MAYASAPLMFNITETCKTLKEELSKFFNGQNKNPGVIVKIMNQMVHHVRQLGKENVEDILRFIIYPYGTRLLEHDSPALAIKMVAFMHWWVSAKSNDIPNKGLLELLRERRVIVVSVGPDRKLTARRLDNPNKPATLSHITRLFNMQRCTGREVDALIELITLCVNYRENNAIDMSKLIMDFYCPKAIWRLYFNPLIIQTASVNGKIIPQAKSQVSFIGKESTRIVWSDGREDMHVTGSVPPRVRVDNLVHQALDACQNKEMLLDILKWIQIERLEAKFILSKWLKLFSILKLREDFDNPICQILLEKIQPTLKISTNESLLNFAVELSDIWSSIVNTSAWQRIREQIIQCIQLLIIGKAPDYITSIRSFTQSMCDRTPVGNHDGNVCFFLLLQDLLPIYQDSNMNSIIREIPDDILSWYIDYVLNPQNEDIEVHRASAMTIMKHVTMFTEINYISILLKKLNDMDEKFAFDLFVNVIYPTTTLSTFIREATQNDVIGLLTSIKSPLAFNYMNPLLLVIEALLNDTRINRYVLESVEIHKIFQTWLMRTSESTAKWQMIKILINLGSSDQSERTADIVEFFIQSYSEKLLQTNFNRVSVLGDILVFIDKQSDEDHISRASEQLIGTLFSYIENEPDSEHILTYSWHIIALSQEIVKEQSRAIIVKYLSPHCPHVIGLLANVKELQRPSIILLRELLNLTENERTIFDELIKETHDQGYNGNGFNDRRNQDKLQFFSSEYEEKISRILVRHTDFHIRDSLLDKLKTAEISQIDKILRSTISTEKMFNKTGGINSSNIDQLVMTATAYENVRKILEVLDDPIPTLLEGSTGVGKSATIIEAAKQSNRTLLRMNMSSRVSIDDLLGNVIFVANRSNPLEFVEGPFTKAYAQGYWILLDELNLSQDTVLQAIESAIDTRSLIIRNPASAGHPIIKYSMHENFRLFATQNPNTGFFKGKREKLSPAFLSRFRPIVFKELPNEEWCEIVKDRLTKHISDEAEHLAETMVNKLHKKIREKFNESGNQSSTEIGPYAEITIRELLKWVDLVIWQKKNEKWPSDLTQLKSWLSFSGWCVYGARFRKNGRDSVFNILSEKGQCELGPPAIKEVKFRVDQTENWIRFDDVSLKYKSTIEILNPHDEWRQILHESHTDSVPFDQHFWDIGLKIHKEIHATLLQENFICSHGIYRINMTWFSEWLKSAASEMSFHDEDKFLVKGCHLYQERFRHQASRRKIIRCFRKFKPNCEFKLLDKISISAHQEIPYVLTDHVLSTMKQVCFNLNIKQPILVTGAEGCGKSELLLTLAWLMGQSVQQLNITPETEPSTLIGQMIPNPDENSSDPDDSNTGKKFIWDDGCVTKAFTHGHWALLDNLNVAESSVLERLNPVLEQQPMLILTEKNDFKEQEVHENYLLVATMTPPDSRTRSNENSSNDLSPALYNRFAIVHMPNELLDSVTSVKSDIEQMAKMILSDEITPEENLLAVSLCKLIVQYYDNNRNSFSRLTLRNLIRLLDSTYRIHLKYGTEIDFRSSLWTAYHVTIANSIKDENIKNQLGDDVKRKIIDGINKSELKMPNFLDEIETDNSYILTSSRKEYVNAILGALVCNIPILLEGPAAVGKTALISYLFKNLKSLKNNDKSSRKIELERLNNSDTTTVQDYLGTYLPMNGTFVFQKGALYRAMEHGWWFLADEFNLADPAVMNMLFPILEGKNTVTVPSTGKTITAKVGFQFFATQNDASYANRHVLPVSLRNRFLEIQFDEFPVGELKDIIHGRTDEGKLRPKCMTQECSMELARFYHLVLKTPLRITFRELVKWIHRHATFSSTTKMWSLIGQTFLGGKYAVDSEMRKALCDRLDEIWCKTSTKTNQPIVIRQSDNYIRISEGELNTKIENIKLKDSIVLKSPDSFKRALIRLCFAVQSNEPVLLIGPTSCKTLLVETWAQLSNRSTDLMKVHLTSETETSDLIGQIQPYSALDSLKRLTVMIELMCSRLSVLYQKNKSDDSSEYNKHQFDVEKQRMLNTDLIKYIEEYEKTINEDQARLHQEEETEETNRRKLRQTVLKASTESAEIIENPSQELYSEENHQDEPLMTAEHDFDCIDDSQNVLSYKSSRFDDNYENQTSSGHQCEENDCWNQLGTNQNESFIRDLDDGLDTDGIHVVPYQVVQESCNDTHNLEPNSASYFTDSGETTKTEPDDLLDDLLDDDLSRTIDNADSESAEDIQPSEVVSSSTSYNYPFGLVKTIDQIIQSFDDIFNSEIYSDIFSKDKPLQDYQIKMRKAWKNLKDTKNEHSKPIFTFNDGPVTIAAKRGAILFLEDIDLPSQAVIERLNSMLELNPTFAITEDITSEINRGQLEIPLTHRFQVFASVHQDHTHQIVKLSPATRSRFTEIYVAPYSNDELKQLVENELTNIITDSSQLESIIEVMFSLRKKLRSEPEWKIDIDVRLLFRWTDFIKNHPQSTSVERRLFLGARFVYFDQLPFSRHTDIFQRWIQTKKENEKYVQYEEIFKQPTAAHGALVLSSASENTASHIEPIFPFEIGSDYVRLRYTGVSCYSSSKSDEDPSNNLDFLKSTFYSVPTTTLINQIARIFAAISSKTPLLLEGPPGIGKTHVVTQVCSLLNKRCERINMSGNTSLDQLIGCVIPRVNNGVRIFQWQEGRIISAINENRCILLDEINLAEPEVLQGLTPLFYRGVKTFTIPNTNQVVNLEGVLIFATMNPSTIGGGRTKLPNSIENLFTKVKLDEYTESELRLILNGDFQDELEKKKIDMSQLDVVFQMHLDLKSLVQRGEIGRTGGPYELNLRDLTKYRDVYRGSIDSQLSHYRYVNTINSDEQEQPNSKQTEDTDDKSLTKPLIDISDARILSMRKFAEVVYACQFQGQTDFEKVSNVIHSLFPINTVLMKHERDYSIDKTISSIVRIGSVYIPTGLELSSKVDNTEFFYTKKTVQQLELLAAACQSKRAVLLEGDICSRKSSLVIELSRLTCHRLVIIPLHENFETSDLIGSWLPKKNLSHKQTIAFVEIDNIFDTITKIILLLVMAVMPKTARNLFTQLKTILLERKSIKASQRMETIASDLENIKNTITLLESIAQIDTISSDVKIHFTYYSEELRFFEKKLNQLNDKKSGDNNEIFFEFVESEFVKAIREGSWVLLDNVNSAPSEVLERLNSLTEEKPMLSLYEKSDGNVLRKGDGIHENFRLFATANLNRIYSNKLSSAFLNRVIRIWLPVIDEVQEEKYLESDLFDILSSKLISIPAGKQFAHLLVIIHTKIKRRVNKNLLQYPTDFSVTYRLLEQCVQTFILFVNRNIHPVDACYWSILRCYCSSIKNRDQYHDIIDDLQKTIKDLNLYLPTTKFSLSIERIDQHLPIWYQESQNIRSKIVQMEKFVSELGLTIIQIVAREETHLKLTRELLQIFIDNILSPMKPKDDSIITFKRKFSNENQTLAEFQTLLDEFTEKQKINILVDLQNFQTIEILVHEIRNETVHSVEMMCDELTKDMECYIGNTSFKDHHDRFTFLRRFMIIIETMEQFFNQEIFRSFPRGTQILELSCEFLAMLRPILKFKEKYRSFQILEDPSFVELKRNFYSVLNGAIKANHGLIWSFERTQTLPIRASRKDMRKLVCYIIEDIDDQTVVGLICHFTTVLEWISLQWTFDTYLTDKVRDLLKNNVLITPSILDQCETLFCSTEIIDKFQELFRKVVNSIPNLLNYIDDEYWKLKSQFESKQTRSKTIQEMLKQQSNSNLDETQSSTQDEALRKELQVLLADLSKMNEELENRDKKQNELMKTTIAVRVNLQEETKKILKLSAYQYLRKHFDQPDFTQFRSFIRILNEDLDKPMMKNTDGLLAIQAVLSSSFGRQWIEHEDLIDASLTYIICGFYFLRGFDRSKKIYIITNWNQLEKDIDLRYFHENDMIFYCSETDQYRSSLIFVKSQESAVTLDLWTLQGDIVTEELEQVLHGILPKSIEFQINKKILPSVDDVITENLSHRFAISCLVLLRQVNDTSEIWVSQIFEETMKIYNQLKEFVQINNKEHQSLISIHRDIEGFKNKLNQFNHSSLSGNPDWFDTEQFWSFVKEYRNRFTTRRHQNLKEKLEKLFRSVRPSNSIGRLISLGYLKTIDNYNCVPMMVSHLQAGSEISDAKTLENYKLLFNFFNKMDLLIKLITQYFMYMNEHLAKDLFDSMPKMISHFEHILQSTLKVIDIEDDHVVVGVFQSRTIFESWQKKLDEHLFELRFPTNFISRYELADLVVDCAPLFSEERSLEIKGDSMNRSRKI